MKSGENITSICEAYEIDYSANVDIILAINGIKDANRIYEGQNLVLPVIKGSINTK